MNIKCSGCGQMCWVDDQCVPATGASVKCKQCDHMIQVCPEMLEVRESDPRKGLFQMQWFRVTGIGAAVLLLGVCAWVFITLSDHGVSTGEGNSVGSRGAANQASGQSTGTIPASHAFAGGPLSEDVGVTPVAAVTLRVPALLQAVQGSAYLADLPPSAQMSMVTLAILSLGTIDLFVCQDRGGHFWPVLRVEKLGAQSLAGQFGPDGALSGYFVQKDAFTFQLNEPVITGALLQVLNDRASEGTFDLPTQDDLSAVPLEQFAVVLKQNQIWLVPDCVVAALTKSPGLFGQASLVTWMARAVSEDDLLRVCARMPGDSGAQWMSRVLDNEFVQAHFGAGLDAWVRLFEAPVTSLLTSVSELDQLAVTLACPTAKERRLTWILQFQDATLAQPVHEQVKAGQVESLLEGHPLGPLVSGIMSCPDIQQTVDLDGSCMTVTCLWHEANDRAIINRLGQGAESDRPEGLGSSGVD